MKRRLLPLVLGCLVALDADAATVNVNCNQGQTIGAALAALNRHGPSTVNVRGTCTEAVEVRHFEQLTLKGRPGAVIAAPPGNSFALQINNSRDLVVRDLTVDGLVLWPCQGCRFSGSTMQGVTLVGGSSSDVTFLKSTLRANGDYAALGIYENSVVVVVNCVIEAGDAPPFWTAIQNSGGSQLTIGGTVIRGFPFGMSVDNGARAALGDASSVQGSDPDQTVVIEDNQFGISVVDGAALSLGNGGAPVRVRNNSDTGVSVSANSTLNMGGDVEISGNREGILLSDSSHATITGGARIIGNRNGIAVVNSSTARGPGSWESSTAQINGNSTKDIFCDGMSIVSNAAQITATSVTCPNLNQGNSVPLP